MSNYLCLLLSGSYDEKGIPEVNKQLTKWGCGDILRRIDQHGPMPMGSALWSVVIRKASQGQVLKFLQEVTWSHPPVQALFKSIDGVVWKEFTIGWPKLG